MDRKKKIIDGMTERTIDEKTEKQKYRMIEVKRE